jgi:hypothetical protein
MESTILWQATCPVTPPANFRARSGSDTYVLNGMEIAVD